MKLSLRLAACLAFLPLLALAGATAAQDAAALRARHAELAEKLRGNAFGRPLHLESSESDNRLRGDVYALLDQPYEKVRPALSRMENWCDILFLYLHVKSCDAAPQADRLTLFLARRHDHPDVYGLEFSYRVESGADYLRIDLHAAEGPLATRDYRISVEAVPVNGRQSFMHLTYSYSQGAAARLATKAYLATAGRNKVGFTIVGRRDNGQPQHIEGVRGIVERNSMRYYLAVEAYLGALDAPPGERLEKRLNDWFTAIERHPRQLHELERAEYLKIKRAEARRQGRD